MDGDRVRTHERKAGASTGASRCRPEACAPVARRRKTAPHSRSPKCPHVEIGRQPLRDEIRDDAISAGGDGVWSLTVVLAPPARGECASSIHAVLRAASAERIGARRNVENVFVYKSRGRPASGLSVVLPSGENRTTPPRRTIRTRKVCRPAARSSRRASLGCTDGAIPKARLDHGAPARRWTAAWLVSGAAARSPARLGIGPQAPHD